ncbi:MAG TPA: hypothetical protein VFQ82_14550 [Stellaceae bacterium]|nr:hypothetical protein [Stellaceae bacterium]
MAGNNLRLGRRLFPTASLAAALVLASGIARAVPVTDFVTVQPIDVCSTSTSCATMNNLGTGKNNVASAGSNVQVGFASNGINITNAIWNLAGINVVFQPTTQLVTANTQFQNVPVVASASAPGQFTSDVFKAMTQQAALSQGAKPTSPLSPNPTTINMFFTNSIVPDPSTPGILYGIGWVGNNGAAVGQNIFGAPGRGGQTVNARADDIAHEIGHVLGLDHTTFGNNPPLPSDLMTAGATRTVPNVLVSNVATQSNATWLTQIVPNGTVSQLLSSQVKQAINPNGGPLNAFLNPIPLISTSATDPRNGFKFNVTYTSGGRTDESMNQLTLTLPSGFFFKGDVDITDNSDPNVSITPSFCGSGRVELHNCVTFALGGAESDQFISGDTFSYNAEICKGSYDNCVTASDEDLAAAAEAGDPATYKFQFSDGYFTTSDLEPEGDITFLADSQNPDAALPFGIVDPETFVGAGADGLPCVPLAGQTACPPLDLADANPADEDVPEPPALAVLLAGLALCPTLARRRGVFASSPTG